MSVTVLIGLAAAFFILGILFIAKGISVEEQNAVPINNPKEIQELKNAFMPPESPAKPKVDLEFNTSNIDESNKTSIVEPVQQTENQQQLEQMKKENEQLKKQISEQQDKFTQLEQNVEILKKEYCQVKDSESREIGILQEEISKIQSEKDQLLPNYELIEDLKKKSELFEKQHAESQARQSEMNSMIKKLESERDELMEKQKNEMNRAEFEMLSNRLNGSISALETLKGENKELLQTNQDLRENFQKTKEFNDQLLEKEKIIQFELAKNRAQALGLEKICEDFQSQIESLSAVAHQR